MSLLLATTSDMVEQDITKEFGKVTSRVAAVAVFSSPTDLKRWKGHLTKFFPFILNRVTALNLEPQELNKFSPIFYVSPDDPPALIAHGDIDPGVPIIEGESMYLELSKAGVKSKFIKIEGGGHSFNNDKPLAETVSWFEKYLVEK